MPLLPALKPSIHSLLFASYLVPSLVFGRQQFLNKSLLSEEMNLACISTN